MKTLEIWNALKPYMTIRGLNKTWTYMLTTAQFIAPIEDIYGTDTGMAVKLRSITIFYDSDLEFNDTIEVSLTKLRLGTKVSGVEGFPMLPHEAYAPNALSYHDIVVYCGNTRYRIADNYAYVLHCNRCGGWSFWFKWQGEEKLLGEEYSDTPFCIAVAGRPIVGTLPEVIEEP